MKGRQGVIEIKLRVVLSLSCICLQYAFFLNASHAQSDPFYWMRDTTEGISERPEAENEYRLMMETLEERKLHPVNLNSATIADLDRIPILTGQQGKTLQVICMTTERFFLFMNCWQFLDLTLLSIIKLLLILSYCHPIKSCRLRLQIFRNMANMICDPGKGKSFRRSRGYLRGDTLLSAGGTKIIREVRGLCSSGIHFHFLTG